MDYLVSLLPLAQPLAFVSLTIAVFAGLMRQALSGGVRFGNRRPEPPPKTTTGKALRLVERIGTGVFFVCLTVILGASLSGA
ncbi:hypothetical protein [uncultured Sulfitobacter sp.]|uniref:hypothetical protein n=1 Tax=uncultured Sulfitobacter sp. TaxID=191468 RepID=UPI002605548A|nr:hypothetical protein [uncultured Sulfitobacter sp.]